MLTNYYSILEVSQNASNIEIKKQYRKLAKKWHPDVNNKNNTTSKMQDITEAYLILSDSEARKRYNEEFLRYNQFREKKNTKSYYKQKSQPKNDNQQKKRTDKEDASYEFYSIEDDILNDWINKAKKQANEFVVQAKIDAVGISKRGVQYSKKSTKFGLIVFIILFILTIILLKSN